jgi:hypothetical protein
MRWFALTVLAATIICSQGCGSPETPAAAGSSSAAAAPNDPVASVVHQFLDAMRRGDGEAASRMLTPLALERSRQRNESLAPPGSPTAKFTVGAPQIENDEAVVKSTWTDVDVDGKPYDEEIICVLRLCDGQWRVYGMAQDLGPNRPPMVMDLERPDAVAAQAPAQTPAAPGAPATAGSNPPGAVAGNPFDQPAQR